MAIKALLDQLGAELAKLPEAEPVKRWGEDPQPRNGLRLVHSVR